MSKIDAKIRTIREEEGRIALGLQGWNDRPVWCPKELAKGINEGDGVRIWLVGQDVTRIEKLFPKKGIRIPKS